MPLVRVMTTDDYVFLNLLTLAVFGLIRGTLWYFKWRRGDE